MKNRILLFALFSILAACGNKIEEKNDFVPAVKENVKEYYANGKLQIEGELRDGQRHGKWVYYYDNGFKWSEGIFRYGKRDGYANIFYKSGLKKISGEYEENKAVGIWKFYSEKGELIASVDAEKNPAEIERLMRESAEKFTQ